MPGTAPHGGHHAPVVLEGVQPHPRQDRLAGGRVEVVRLVHVPQQGEPDAGGDHGLLVQSAQPRMRTLDRYVLRETLAPFALALLVLTFILIIPFIIAQAETMIAKGVPWLTVAHVMVTLLPQALGLTIPMALLVGAAGRARPALGRPRGGGHAGLRPEPAAAAAPGAGPRRRRLGGHLVGDAVGDPRRQPDLPRDHHPAGRRPRRGRGQAAGLLRGLPRLRRLRARGAGRRRLDRRAGRRHRARRSTRCCSSPSTAGCWSIARSAPSRWCSPTAPATAPRRAIPTATRWCASARCRVARPRERVPARRAGPRRARDDDRRAAGRADTLVKAGHSPHNPLMEIQKKFSIPAACLVFALIGVALGATHRRDGKLVSFMLGIAVIFVYWGVMLVGQSLAKGQYIGPWLATWLPNLLLGAAGDRRRCGARPARGPPPAVAARCRPCPASPRAAAAASPARRCVSRVPDLTWLRPTLLDLYVGLLYLRMLGLGLVGMAGLFYISTFIDLSDHLFKGTATTGMLFAYFWWSTPQFVYYIIAIAVLLAARGHHRRADQEQRADRDARLRHQPVPHRGAAAGRGGRRLAGAVRARGAAAGAGQPAGQRAELPDSRAESADLRRPQPQVAHRRGRRALPLPVLQPAAAGAERPDRAALRPGRRRADRRRGPSPPRRPPAPGEPRSAALDRPQRLDAAPSIRRWPSPTFTRFGETPLHARSARDVRHRGAAALADELRPAAHLHRATCGPAATTCARTRWPCTARSPSRSSRW